MSEGKWVVGLMVEVLKRNMRMERRNNELNTEVSIESDLVGECVKMIKASVGMINKVDSQELEG